MTAVSPSGLTCGVGAAVTKFVVIRMTWAGGFGIALLLLESAFAGVYAALPQSACGKRTAATAKKALV